MTATQIETVNVLDLPEVGSRVPVADRGTLPVGTVLRGMNHWTKESDGLWRRTDSDTRRTGEQLNASLRVESYPLYYVGLGLTTREQADALPVGTVLQVWVGDDPSYRLVKNPVGNFVRADNADFLYEPGQLTLNGRTNVVALLPDGTAPLDAQVADVFAISEGEEVEVRSSEGAGRWTRRGDTLVETDSGTTLPLSTFVGAAEAGRIRRFGTAEPTPEPVVTPHIQVGHAYKVSGSLTYFVTGRDESNYWTLLRVDPDTGAPIGPDRAGSGWTVDEEVEAEWVRMLASFITPPCDHDPDAIQREAWHRGLMQGRDEGRREFRDHMVEEWDGSSFLADEVNALCENFGLPGLESDIDVTISVSGTTTIEMDRSEVEQQIHDGRIVDCYDTIEEEVTWQHSLSHTIRGVNGECVCDGVDSGTVEHLLDENGIRYSGFEFEVSCEND